MDYIHILQEMLRYIDSNIKEKLSVEKLAARAGFSPYHFCRVFQWEIGYSIYKFADGKVDVELYDERNMGEKGYVCEIYIPVVKATK